MKKKICLILICYAVLLNSFVQAGIVIESTQKNEEFCISQITYEDISEELPDLNKEFIPKEYNGIRIICDTKDYLAIEGQLRSGDEIAILKRVERNYASYIGYMAYGVAIPISLAFLAVVTYDLLRWPGGWKHFKAEYVLDPSVVRRLILPVGLDIGLPVAFVNALWKNFVTYSNDPYTIYLEKVTIK